MIAAVKIPNSRQSSVRCVCDMRKKYETIVQKRVKENANKLLVIGTVDFKMMYEILKEVDNLHKEKFDEIFKNKDAVEVTNEDESAATAYENIFLDNKN